MPRRHTALRRRQTGDDITPNAAEWAFMGWVAIAGYPFRDESEYRSFWKKHRKVLLQWWHNGVPIEHPETFSWRVGLTDRLPHDRFSRPSAWWEFEAPELRQCVSKTESKQKPDGYWEHHERPVTSEDSKRIAELNADLAPHFGVPASSSLYNYETEMAYLVRLGFEAPPTAEEIAANADA